MRQKTKFWALIALSLCASFFLFSCDNSRDSEAPTIEPRPPHPQECRLIAYVNDGEGRTTKVDLSDHGLRSRGPQVINGAEITGLGVYYHNEPCELGITATPASNKRVRFVYFKYPKGEYQSSDLPTTPLEYDKRTLPINPNGYEVNFRLDVHSNIFMYVELEKKISGVGIEYE